MTESVNNADEQAEQAGEMADKPSDGEPSTPSTEGVEVTTSSPSPAVDESSASSSSSSLFSNETQSLLLGLDFGSSVSVLSSTWPGNDKLPVLVTNHISNVTTPSLVGFRENQRLFGDDCLTNDPENTVKDVKYLLGKSLEEVAEARAHYLAPLCASKDFGGRAGVTLQYCDQTSDFSCEELTAMLLRQLASFGSVDGAAGTHIMVSVPSCFTDRQKAALSAAAKIAGINVAGYIHDLASAALVYAYTRSSNLSDGDIVLFADMGQCYFQLQVVQFKGGRAAILASHGEELGGRQFTQRLHAHLAEEVAAKYKIDVTKSARHVWQMAKEADRLKMVLSTIPATKFEYFIMDTDVSVPISRAKFDELCGDLLARIEPAVQQVKQRAVDALRKEEGDAFDEAKFSDLTLEVTGGGVIVPAVLRRLTAAAGVKDARRSLDSRSCFSLGAGLYASAHFDAATQSIVIGKSTEEGAASSAVPRLVVLDETIEAVAPGAQLQLCEQVLHVAREREQEMYARDKSVRELASKKNELEETIYRLRDKIRDAPEEAGLKNDEQKRDKLFAALKDVEDWLLYTEEAETATVADLDAKLDGMRAAVKDVAPQFHSWLEEQELMRRKAEELAKLESEKMKGVRTRDKLERPLTKAEFIAAAEKRKQQGNLAIKEDDFDGARVRYKQALENLVSIREEPDEEETKTINQIKVACYLNIAFCFLKSKDKEDKVIYNCNEALTIEPNNVKALFRRGTANFALKKLDEAKADFQAVLKHDEANKAAKKQLMLVEKKIAQQVASEKKMYGKMFG